MQTCVLGSREQSKAHANGACTSWTPKTKRVHTCAAVYRRKAAHVVIPEPGIKVHFRVDSTEAVFLQHQHVKCYNYKPTEQPRCSLQEIFPCQSS